MHLARVIGRVVATQCYPGLEGVALQVLQPLGEDGKPEGGTLVATAPMSVGPGDLVSWVDGREAALTCPETYVPVDASVTGFVEQAAVHGAPIAREENA